MGLLEERRHLIGLSISAGVGKLLPNSLSFLGQYCTGVKLFTPLLT